MQLRLIQSGEFSGPFLSAFVIWIYATEPRTSEK